MTNKKETNGVRHHLILGGVATSIAAGGKYSCAVVNGGIACWGFNAQGELGMLPTNTVYYMPTALPGPNNRGRTTIILTITSIHGFFQP